MPSGSSAGDSLHEPPGVHHTQRVLCVDVPPTTGDQEAQAAADGTPITVSAHAGGQLAYPRVLPNLGYACLTSTLRQFDVFTSRDCVKKTFDRPDGIATVSRLALANAQDILPQIRWNEAHGIRLFRLSSGIIPWMSKFELEDLPDWPAITQALRTAGDAARSLGHRLTFHPSEFVKIGGERREVVEQSVRELEVHSRIFDEMGFLPATPYNKINIHVGATYGGDKAVVLKRFAQVVTEQLSPNCRARLTVENDDRASLYSLADLMELHRLCGTPLVFDLHHHKFNTGGLTAEQALRRALATWPAGVRPMVHWSESPEDESKPRHAHSDYVIGPIHLFGLEGSVDVMIESKAKELALLEYREAALSGRQRRAAPPDSLKLAVPPSGSAACLQQAAAADGGQATPRAAEGAGVEAATSRGGAQGGTAPPARATRRRSPGGKLAGNAMASEQGTARRRRGKLGSAEPAPDAQQLEPAALPGATPAQQQLAVGGGKEQGAACQGAGTQHDGHEQGPAAQRAHHVQLGEEAGGAAAGTAASVRGGRARKRSKPAGIE